MDNIFTLIEAKREEYETFLQELITIESYTLDKAGVNAVGDKIRSFAERKGFHVKTIPFEKAGNGLLITWNEEAALPPVAFTGHMDTVFPKGTFDPPRISEDGWTILWTWCF